MNEICYILNFFIIFQLYNVVVENEQISAKLIEHGKLLKRTTFIPMNKIQGHRIDQQTIRRAQQEVSL